jgi:large subunit ribosomal protein L4
MNADIFSSDGTKKGTIELPKSIFEVSAASGLMHEALLRQHGNARVSSASVKTRSQVKGGGKKPWRQKGTGRARQGSIRSAQWKGGGVIFGPTDNRNFSKNMPKKMRRKAMLGALSTKAQSKDIVVLESFAETTPKTKSFSELIQKIGCNGKTLVVLSGRNEIIEKSSRNVPGVKSLFAQYLNIQDILTANTILFLQDAVEKTSEIFGEKK